MTQADQRQVSPEAAIKAELGEIKGNIETYEERISKLRERGVVLEAALQSLTGKPSQPEPKPAEAKKPKKAGRTKKSSRIGEENKRRFRDYARSRKGEPFTYNDAAEALGLHRSSILALAKWAVGRNIVKRGKAVLTAGQQGRRPTTFTYVEKVPEPKQHVRAEAVSPPRIKSAPIAGTGGNGVMQGASPEVQELVAKLKDQGWPTPTLNGAGHLTVRNAKGTIITTLPKTPSDSRSIPNAKAILKRAGAKV